MGRTGLCGQGKSGLQPLKHSSSRGTKQSHSIVILYVEIASHFVSLGRNEKLLFGMDL